MTNHTDPNPEYLALLAEEITQEELRALLRRLGEQEFGDPKPTIGAVVEATGADVLTVSKMLRAIRSENLDQKIEKAFGPRDQKIERLEKVTQVIEDKIDRRLPVSRHEGAWFSDSWDSDRTDPESREILTDVVRREKSRREAERFGIWMAAILLVAMFVYILLNGYPGRASDQPGGRRAQSRDWTSSP